MLSKKSMVLSDLDGSNKRAVLTLEKTDDDVHGSIRFYNFPIHIEGILTLGFYVNNKVIKSGLTYKSTSYYTFLLNEDFINQAFSKEERAVIQTTEVDNSKEQGYNPWWESEHGMWLESDTKDQIFLLSYKEAFKDYFSDDASRICTPTDYAIAQGAFTSDEGNCTWWLRLPRANQDIAAKVRADGSYDGGSVYFDDICIRPALWVNLESDIF